MSNERVTYDPYIATAVLDCISQILERKGSAIGVAFEELTADPGKMPRMMLQPLASDAFTRRYISGESLGSFPFAVTLRVAADCEQDSLDAATALAHLARDWASAAVEAEGYVIFRQSQLTVPVRLGRTERFEDWQVTLELKYKQTAH